MAPYQEGLKIYGYLLLWLRVSFDHGPVCSFRVVTPLLRHACVAKVMGVAEIWAWNGFYPCVDFLSSRNLGGKS